MKPLGRKAYGSIPHLPGSRLGPGDHHCHDGQARIATVKVRDRKDIVVVTEKVDGSCCAVAKLNNTIIPLTRSGYIASTSPFYQHQVFYDWAFTNYARFDALLLEGERVVGEWMVQVHGTRYNLHHEPFVAFDIMVDNKRLPFRDASDRLHKCDFITPYIVHLGGALSISDAMDRLGPYGYHGAIDPVEGAVWKVERDGKVDFLCKYVRPDKVDGKYLEEEIWNSSLTNCSPVV